MATYGKIYCNFKKEKQVLTDRAKKRNGFARKNRGYEKVNKIFVHALRIYDAAVNAGWDSLHNGEKRKEQVVDWYELRESEPREELLRLDDMGFPYDEYDQNGPTPIGSTHT